jgi:hypothetical protein
MKFLRAKYLLLLFGLILFSCKPRQPQIESLSEQDIESLQETYDELMAAKTIFYDIYSPVEASRVFQEIGAVFDMNILNPVRNADSYVTSQKRAINLGIYGADLSFCRMFGQTQESINYLSAIYKLSEQLGIPSDLISENQRKLEKHISNPDSLFDIASRIYVAADAHLKEADRASAAALILTGGWVEAMYIATWFYDPANPEQRLIDQIALQKYSLNRLITHLNNLHEEPEVGKYLLMLRQLKNVYDRFEIFYEMNDVKIDTLRKEIKTTSVSTNIQPADIQEIKHIVQTIRSQIVL